jgi:hypothetical protein
MLPILHQQYHFPPFSGVYLNVVNELNGIEYIPVGIYNSVYLNVPFVYDGMSRKNVSGESLMSGS